MTDRYARTLAMAALAKADSAGAVDTSALETAIANKADKTHCMMTGNGNRHAFRSMDTDYRFSATTPDAIPNELYTGTSAFFQQCYWHNTILNTAIASGSSDWRMLMKNVVELYACMEISLYECTIPVCVRVRPAINEEHQRRQYAWLIEYNYSLFGENFQTVVEAAIATFVEDDYGNISVSNINAANATFTPVNSGVCGSLVYRDMVYGNSRHRVVIPDGSTFSDGVLIDEMPSSVARYVKENFADIASALCDFYQMDGETFARATEAVEFELVFEREYTFYLPVKLERKWLEADADGYMISYEVAVGSAYDSFVRVDVRYALSDNLFTADGCTVYSMTNIMEEMV